MGPLSGRYLWWGGVARPPPTRNRPTGRSPDRQPGSSAVRERAGSFRRSLFGRGRSAGPFRRSLFGRSRSAGPSHRSLLGRNRSAEEPVGRPVGAGTASRCAASFSPAPSASHN